MRILNFFKKNTDPLENGYDYINEGVKLRENEKIPQAVAMWKKAYDLDKNNPEYQFFYLTGLWESGEKDSARVKKLIANLLPQPQYFTFEAPFDTPEMVAKALQKYGLVHLKKAVPLEVIAQWEHNLKDNLAIMKGLKNFEYSDDSTANESYVLPSYFVAPHPDKQAFRERFINAMTASRQYEPVSFSEEENHYIESSKEMFKTNNVLKIISLFLQREMSSLKAHGANSMARSIQGGHESDGGPHQDGCIQNRRDLFSTLWMPFTHAGDGISPSLLTLPIRINTFAPAFGKDKNFIANSFPHELYYNPLFEPGDILLHSTFSLHTSYAKKDMPNRRSSLDLRFF